MKPEVVAVIQARTGSLRLPAKVLRPVAGAPVLAHVIRRVRAAPTVDRVVVATTTLGGDDAVAAVATAEGAAITRGSEHDVLARFAAAFEEHGGTIGVRVTSDCPCLDPRLLEQMLVEFQRWNGRLDYLSNTVVRTFPRGYDLEVFRVSALLKAAAVARDPSSREHVTPFLYRHPELFAIESYTRDDPQQTAAWRLTLDEEADWRVIEHLFDALAPSDPLFGLDAVSAYLRSRPDVLRWNAAVEQRAH